MERLQHIWYKGICLMFVTTALVGGFCGTIDAAHERAPERTESARDLLDRAEAKRKEAETLEKEHKQADAEKAYQEAQQGAKEAQQAADAERKQAEDNKDEADKILEEEKAQYDTYAWDFLIHNKEDIDTSTPDGKKLKDALDKQEKAQQQIDAAQEVMQSAEEIEQELTEQLGQLQGGQETVTDTKLVDGIKAGTISPPEALAEALAAESQAVQDKAIKDIVDAVVEKYAQDESVLHDELIGLQAMLQGNHWGTFLTDLHLSVLEVKKSDDPAVEGLQLERYAYYHAVSVGDYQQQLKYLETLRDVQEKLLGSNIPEDDLRASRVERLNERIAQIKAFKPREHTAFEKQLGIQIGDKIPFDQVTALHDFVQENVVGTAADLARMEEETNISISKNEQEQSKKETLDRAKTVEQVIEQSSNKELFSSIGETLKAVRILLESDAIVEIPADISQGLEDDALVKKLAQNDPEATEQLADEVTKEEGNWTLFKKLLSEKFSVLVIALRIKAGEGIVSLFGKWQTKINNLTEGKEKTLIGLLKDVVVKIIKSIPIVGGLLKTVVEPVTTKITEKLQTTVVQRIKDAVAEVTSKLLSKVTGQQWTAEDLSLAVIGKQLAESIQPKEVTALQRVQANIAEITADAKAPTQSQRERTQAVSDAIAEKSAAGDSEGAKQVFQDWYKEALDSYKQKSEAITTSYDKAMQEIHQALGLPDNLEAADAQAAYKKALEDPQTSAAVKQQIVDALQKMQKESQEVFVEFEQMLNGFKFLVKAWESAKLSEDTLKAVTDGDARALITAFDQVTSLIQSRRAYLKALTEAVTAVSDTMAATNAGKDGVMKEADRQLLVAMSKSLAREKITFEADVHRNTQDALDIIAGKIENFGQEGIIGMQDGVGALSAFKEFMLQRS